ncbi:hypothetical protein Tco_0580250, partial [Tanacetum coccineum]
WKLLFFDVATSFDSDVHRVHAVSFDVASTVSAACIVAAGYIVSAGICDAAAIDAIPLATKPSVIVEYKLLKEGIMTLWKLVKIKHGDTRPEDEHERVLWGDLKVMFEPDIKSDVWRNLQG